MATIPIEVIVQDAEAPVVPSEDGANNTNTEEVVNSVAVPDTGNGTMDSGINSSASAIIIPAVILVLAIGGIIAILIRRYNKRKVSESGITRQERRATIVTSTIAVLALTVLLGQLLTTAVVQPNSTNAATSDSTEDHIDVADKISIVIERTADETEAEAIVENTSTVTSTADFGYRVLLAMAEGADTANLYLDGDTTSEYYIAPVNSEEDEAVETAETNIWGYALEEDGEYSAMPLADDAAIVAKEVATAEDKEIPVYYGVRVSKDLPNGTYTGELTYDLTDYIATMQEMTSDICDAVPTPGNQVTDPVPTATLTDIRDDKTYTIAKLADGNCWMTQNLDFDIIGGGADLNSTNTDVPQDWVDAGNLANTYMTNDTVWGYSTTAPESYDPGDLYWNGALKPQDEAACTQYGGTWKIPSDSVPYCDGVNFITSTGDKHYYLGNYYNWTAAVAMSNSEDYTTDNTDVNQSICPAGWTLPKSGAILTGPGSFQYLVDQAELSAGISGNIQNSPTYFVYSDNWWGGSLGSGGDDGCYWSSVVESSGGSYQLGFDASGRLYSQGQSGYRGAGYSIRCLAR